MKYGNAVVVGAGIGGVVAARAILPFFDRVTIVEKDALEPRPVQRKGVPQGAHLHVLLIRGANALEELFPGFLRTLEAAGSISADSGRGLAFFLRGGWMPRQALDLPARLQSRPFLEFHLREQLLTAGDVEILDNTAVRNLLIKKDRVCGVEVGDGATKQVIEADFVVDASGRGSRLPKWLIGNGYEAVPESACSMNLTYASRFVVGLKADFDALLVYPDPPSHRRGGALYRQEGNRWIVTLAEYGTSEAPRDDDAFIEFAEGLPTKALGNLLRSVTPASPIEIFHTPEARWRHYERLPMFPGGLAALGDAVCHFNPIFGQGMSVAARCALELRSCLRRGGPADVRKEFRERVKAVTRNPWRVSTTLDLAFPTTVGMRTVGLGLVHAYLRRLFVGMRTSPSAFRRFMKVLHMVEGPSALMAPNQVLAAIAGSLIKQSDGCDEAPPPPPGVGPAPTPS